MATEQVVVMLGQATIPHGHPDDLALRLLACHLGAGMSGLLFQRLREENGVAYETGVHHPVRAGAAPFLLHASTSADRADLTLRLLMQIWWELREGLLGQAELALARAKFIGQMAHAGQTCSQRAERNVQLCGLGLPQDFDQQCQSSLESLDAEALRQVADRWLHRPSLSLCGPRQSLETLSRLWCSQSPRACATAPAKVVSRHLAPPCARIWSQHGRCTCAVVRKSPDWSERPCTTGPDSTLVCANVTPVNARPRAGARDGPRVSSRTSLSAILRAIPQDAQRLE